MRNKPLCGGLSADFIRIGSRKRHRPQCYQNETPSARWLIGCAALGATRLVRRLMSIIITNSIYTKYDI